MFGQYLRRESLKVLLPSLLAILLFAAAIFWIILPYFQNSVMERKRESIRELTQTAWDILAFYHDKEMRKEITRARAQAQAAALVRSLRYGPDNKDYFWINDMRAVMVMHPYRRDLEGKDLTDFQDSRGKYLLREFVKTVKEHDEGYVSYMWQWKDNPNLIVPKLSYVKGFKPWKWIVGTGIYLEDVRREVALVSRYLTYACLSILLVIIIACAYIVRRGVLAEQLRRRAEDQLRLINQNLESRVAERTEELTRAMEEMADAQDSMSSPPPVAAPAKPLSEMASSRSLHILLAEDEPTNQLAARGMLERLGHRVTTVKNGLQALQAVEKDRFDLVLMDVQMPEVDGLEATRRIRRWEKDSGRRTPIVAMTALAMKGDRERCLEAGMDGYISKPIDPSDLHQTVERYAGGKETGGQGPRVRLDRRTLLSVFGGEEKFLKENIKLFLTESASRVDQISQALDDGNIEEMTRLAHSLKGSVGYFDPGPAFEAALALEVMGREGDLSGAPRALRKLRELMDELVDQLRRMLAD